MNNQDPLWNFEANYEENKAGQSSSNENFLDFSDYCFSPPNSWFQTTTPLNTNSTMMDDFNGYFGVSMDLPIFTPPLMQPDSGIASMSEFTSESNKGRSSGTVNTPDELVVRKYKSDGTRATASDLKISKRTRASETHNMSERRRRDRINKRLRTLKELVPYSSRADSSSILDNAASYLKYLKHQVDLLMAREAHVFQVPYMSPSGFAGSQASQSSQFVPIRHKLNMGMVGMCYPTVPMGSAPLAGFHPAYSGGVGLHSMNGLTNFAVPQMHMPFYNSQVQMPNLIPGFSPAPYVSSQVSQLSSQAGPSTDIDPQQQLSMITQESCPSISSSSLPVNSQN